jgi:hypothetical protein
LDQTFNQGQIYSIEHQVTHVDPAALGPLGRQAYPGLTEEQMRRLRGYINNTIKRFPGYDRVQHYYFLQAAADDALGNRPQMVPSSPIVKGYQREALLAGGVLS